MVNISWIQLGVTLLVLLGGMLGMAWRVGYVIAAFIGKINEQMSSQKAEFNALLSLKEEELAKKVKETALNADGKVARVYERFDEYKNFLEANFVRVDMCHLVQKTTNLQNEAVIKKLDDQGAKIDVLIKEVASIRGGTNGQA